MVDILHEVIIEKPAQDIYHALTQADGIAGWWTTDVAIKPEVGSIAEFGFYNRAALFKFKIDELNEPQKVKWVIHNTTEGAPPDWQGTNVTWDLTPVETGTKVLLGHRNYQSTQGSFANVSYQWAGYLSSLKAYLETGKGSPHSS